MRLIALYGVDSYGARDEKGLTVLMWCSANPYDIPELDNYYTNGPSLNIKKNVIRSSNGKYLCSDKFPVHHKLNPCTDFKGKENTDILAGLGTTNTAANAAIAKAGGLKLSVIYYWSSSEYSDSRAITLHPD